VDAQEARTQLEQVLRELDATAATLEREDAGESSELSHIDQHPADTASEISELDRENAVLEHAGAQRTEIEAALARIDDGTWGTCSDCGKQIPAARLAVRPEASRCVDCQAAFEAAAA
jgi:DnaK suppressor protein